MDARSQLLRGYWESEDGKQALRELQEQNVRRLSEAEESVAQSVEHARNALAQAKAESEPLAVVVRMHQSIFEAAEAVRDEIRSELRELAPEQV